VFKTLEKVWSLSLDAEFGHADVSREVETIVAESDVTTGMVTIGLVGSTGAVTTIEYESGALADLRTALEIIAPSSGEYEHNERWGDGNGFSHVRSALMKTSITIPVVAGRPALGTWQQVVVINLDNRARNREVVVVVVGE
jgi:secondary thiamine-phosphate synthase enzyme